jgi:GntR family transcriptional regulator, carbon starvation induced regulator
MKRALGDQEKSASQAAKTFAEVAYQRLHADIVWGRAEPGSPLRFTELQVSYRIGISPLREALSRLVSEGLVTAEGQRGFRVAPISVEEVQDLLQTRMIVEGEALRRSIIFGDDKWEGDLLAASHRLASVTVPHEPGPSAEVWAKRHHEFHATLISASRSPLMIRFAAILFHKAERYRLLRTQKQPEPDLSRDVAAEHKILLHAALSRDADTAVYALRAHYQRTADYAVAALNSLAAA